jgi:hypothetical protein
MVRGKDYAGNKYGHLTLIRYLKPGGSGVGAIWLARCDCGTERELIARTAVHGRIRSCGNCQYSRELTAAGATRGSRIRAGQRRLYVRYLNKAVTRGITWTLTPEQFIDIITKPCVYCGTDPDQANNPARMRHSGLDRVESHIGYTPDNCIAACSICRAMKGDLNASDFLEKIQKISRRLMEE